MPEALAASARWNGVEAVRVRRRRAPARHRRRPGAAVPGAVRARQAGPAPRPRAHRAADGGRRGLGDDDDRRRDPRARPRRRRVRQPRHRARAALRGRRDVLRGARAGAARPRARPRRATSCSPRAAPRTSRADVGDFDGRIALVTGGASGIGAAAVALLRERGARGRLVRPRPVGAADGVLRVAGDAPTRARSTTRWRGSSASSGPLDAVVCCAGTGGDSLHTADISDEEWRRVFALNCDGVFYFNRAARPRDGAARARADREHRLDRRQGGQPDGGRLLGQQGRGDRHDEVVRQGPRRRPACS